MNDPLVSVVIPLYNKEQFIFATLRSVISQTYQNIELIVIDDGSTDKSLEIVKFVLLNSERLISRVVIESQGNRGQTFARNHGVTLSKGQYIAFLDADDIWAPDKIQKQVSFMEDNLEIEMLLTNYAIIGSSPFRSRYVNLKPLQKQIRNWLYTIGFGCLPESTSLVRRSCFEREKKFNPDMEMHGGLDLVLKLSYSNKVALLNEYLVCYRMEAQGWHNNKQDLVDSFQKLLVLHSGYYNVKELEIYIRCYLIFYDFRNRKDWTATSTFLSFFFQNSYICLNFAGLTIHRLVIGTIRALLNWNKSSTLRKTLNK